MYYTTAAEAENPGGPSFNGGAHRSPELRTRLPHAALRGLYLTGLIWVFCRDFELGTATQNLAS